jgi:hypothetical protein
MSDVWTISELAEAIHHLSAAREQLRTANLITEKLQCEAIIKRLMNQLDLLTTPESLEKTPYGVGND